MLLLLATALRPSTPFRAAPAAPTMVFGLNPPAGAGSFLPPLFQPKSEVLREGGNAVDFQLETLHLTKRRVSGGVLVRAPPDAIWSVITDYEAMPEVIPNILSNVVNRDAERVTIEQESLLSSRMNL